MAAKSKPQFAAVERSFGFAPPNIHCPICGHNALAMNDPDVNVTPCDHLAFIFVGDAGEFLFESEDFAKRRAAEGEEWNSFKTFAAYLTKLGYGNGMLALEVTYGGMACGPCWYTDTYGFDFSKN